MCKIRLRGTLQKQINRQYETHIDQPTLEITGQQQKDLIPSEKDPCTLAFTLVLFVLVLFVLVLFGLFLLFKGMRILIPPGVDWEEVRSHWVELLRNLFEIKRKGEQAKCSRDCKRFEDCNKVSREPEARAETGKNE